MCYEMFEIINVSIFSYSKNNGDESGSLAYNHRRKTLDDIQHHKFKGTIHHRLTVLCRTIRGAMKHFIASTKMVLNS